jgi:hypothetical protein
MYHMVGMWVNMSKPVELERKMTITHGNPHPNFYRYQLTDNGEKRSIFLVTGYL